MEHDPQTLTISSVAGFTSGYACMKLGKVGVFVAGTGVIVIQALQHYGYLETNWQKAGQDFSNFVDQMELQKKAIEIMSTGMPSVAVFSTSFLVGLRMGK